MNLTNDITYYHNTHTTTGFIGIRYEMPVLSEIGRSDLAYELAMQDTFPSWGYMLKQGATTFWELWQEKTGPSMNSQDHIMFGSVGAWFYQALANIDQEPESTGFRHVRINPQMVEDLNWASGTVQTIRAHFLVLVAHAHLSGSESEHTGGGRWPGCSAGPAGVHQLHDHRKWSRSLGKRTFVSGDPGVSSALEEVHGRIRELVFAAFRPAVMVSS